MSASDAANTPKTVFGRVSLSTYMVVGWTGGHWGALSLTSPIMTSSWEINEKIITPIQNYIHISVLNKLYIHF